jgi:hypothetical protein
VLVQLQLVGARDISSDPSGELGSGEVATPSVAFSGHWGSSPRSGCG